MKKKNKWNTNDERIAPIKQNTRFTHFSTAFPNDSLAIDRIFHIRITVVHKLRASTLASVECKIGDSIFIEIKICHNENDKMKTKSTH